MYPAPSGSGQRDTLRRPESCRRRPVVDANAVCGDWSRGGHFPRWPVKPTIRPVTPSSRRTSEVARRHNLGRAPFIHWVGSQELQSRPGWGANCLPCSDSQRTSRPPLRPWSRRVCSRLFLGGLLSSRARLRLASCYPCSAKWWLASTTTWRGVGNLRPVKWGVLIGP